MAGFRHRKQPPPKPQGVNYKQVGWRVYYRWLDKTDNTWVYTTNVVSPCENEAKAIARTRFVNRNFDLEVLKTEEIILNCYKGIVPWCQGEVILQHPEGGLPVYDHATGQWWS
jgi:hypothetical protein